VSAAERHRHRPAEGRTLYARTYPELRPAAPFVVAEVPPPRRSWCGRVAVAVWLTALTVAGLLAFATPATEPAAAVCDRADSVLLFGLCAVAEAEVTPLSVRTSAAAASAQLGQSSGRYGVPVDPDQRPVWAVAGALLAGAAVTAACGLLAVAAGRRYGTGPRRYRRGRYRFRRAGRGAQLPEGYRG
jgi:hypothetical protein